MHRKVSLGISVLILIVAVLLSSFGSIMAYKTWTGPNGKTDTVIPHGSPDETSADTGDGTSAPKEIDEDAIAQEISELRKYIDMFYIGEVDADLVKDLTLTGFVAGIGDKYGGYYNPEVYEQLQSDMDGDMQGIGVSVIFNADMQAIEVIDVFPDSPAMEAGVEVGDLIVYCGEDLESVSFIGYEAALAKLRGPAGTKAKFVAYRGENYTEEVEFEIERAKIVEQSVRYRVYEPDKSVGVIKITSFNTATVEQFKTALAELREQGVEKLVFDVRNNPGGELQSICHILDVLVPEGPVIRTKVKGAEAPETIYTSDPDELDMPMAVITNGSTASAAELFTSALRDYEKALIVGENTYGKGSMQSMYPLKNGGCIKLTSALYYPPFSDNYDGVGIKPDVEVTLSEEASKKSVYKLTDEEDDQLKAAVKALTEK